MPDDIHERVAQQIIATPMPINLPDYKRRVTEILRREYGESIPVARVSTLQLASLQAKGEALCEQNGHLLIEQHDLEAKLSKADNSIKQWQETAFRYEAEMDRRGTELAKARKGFDLVGKWLSAAFDDPAVCDEMKADIRQAFELRGADEEKRR